MAVFIVSPDWRYVQVVARNENCRDPLGILSGCKHRPQDDPALLSCDSAHFLYHLFALIGTRTDVANHIRDSTDVIGYTQRGFVTACVSVSPCRIRDYRYLT
jgi:hypothetical protein